MTKEGHHLDPQDWDAFRTDFHRLLDKCVDRMQGARDLPWQPVPDGFIDQLSPPVTRILGSGVGCMGQANP